MSFKSQPCTCEYCGKGFMSKNQKRIPQRFCSKTCSSWGRKKHTTVPARQRGIWKPCVVCKEPFYVTDSPSLRMKGGGKYCSRRCKGIASRHTPRPCDTCGETFQPTFNTSKHFCSPTCRTRARRNGKEVLCALCGTLIYLPKLRIEAAKHYFCCLEHANKWQARTKISFMCIICGKSFTWSPSRAKGNVQYCSLACRNKDPQTAKRLRAMNVQQQQRTINKLERLGYALLEDLGLCYEPQKTIGGKFCVDAFLPNHQTVIQFDGDYWHGNPARFPILSPRQHRRATLDASQDAYMAVCGYRVIRIWETDLHKNLPAVKAQLQHLLALA